MLISHHIFPCASLITLNTHLSDQGLREPVNIKISADALKYISLDLNVVALHIIGIHFLES